MAGGTLGLFHGTSLGYADGAGSNALFRGIDGLLITEEGILFVADTANSRIRTIVFTGSTYLPRLM